MTVKEFQKLIKWCKKQGLSYAKFDDFEYSLAEPINKTKEKKNKAPKNDKIEGLVHDESAKMPNDSEMLFFSTPTFDQMNAARKETKARNEV